MMPPSPFASLAAVVLIVGLAGCAGTPEAEPELGPLIASKPLICEGHTNYVTSVAVSPDGKLVASGSVDQTLRFWDAKDGKLIRTVVPSAAPLGTDWAGALAFSHDGKTLAVCSRGRLYFYDAATGRPAPERSPVREGGYDTIFSPDDEKLAVAGNEGVRVWGIAKGDKLHEFAKNNAGGRAWRVAFSSDGKHIAVALHHSGTPHNPEGPMVRVWNLASGAEVFGVRDDPHDSSNAVAFSPNGRLLALDAGAGSVEVYEWAKNKRVARFQCDPRLFFCLAFSPDGRSIFTGGNDPEVKRWDAANGKLAGVLKGHSEQVADIALSKDGKVLASAGRDKWVLIWHLGAK